MRNEALVKVCENLAKKASDYADEGDFLRAKVYSGIALDFLKLANATPSDFKKVSSLLPDLEEESNGLTVGDYRDGEWVTTPTSPIVGLLREGKSKINLG